MLDKQFAITKPFKLNHSMCTNVSNKNDLKPCCICMDKSCICNQISNANNVKQCVTQWQ